MSIVHYLRNDGNICNYSFSNRKKLDWKNRETSFKKQGKCGILFITCGTWKILSIAHYSWSRGTTERLLLVKCETRGNTDWLLFITCETWKNIHHLWTKANIDWVFFITREIGGTLTDYTSSLINHCSPLTIHRLFFEILIFLQHCGLFFPLAFIGTFFHTDKDEGWRRMLSLSKWWPHSVSFSNLCTQRWLIDDTEMPEHAVYPGQ